MFDGHQLYILDDSWVFDLTTFIGYRTEMAKDKRTVLSYNQAFTAIRDKDTGLYAFRKYLDVPIRILRKTISIIENYRTEALLENAANRCTEQ